MLKYVDGSSVYVTVFTSSSLQFLVTPTLFRESSLKGFACWKDHQLAHTLSTNNHRKCGMRTQTSGKNREQILSVLQNASLSALSQRIRTVDRVPCGLSDSDETETERFGTACSWDIIGMPCTAVPRQSPDPPLQTEKPRGTFQTASRCCSKPTSSNKYDTPYQKCPIDQELLLLHTISRKSRCIYSFFIITNVHSLE